MSQSVDQPTPEAADSAPNGIPDSPSDGFSDGIQSPARRHLLALAGALGGAAFAGALFNPARADLVAKVGKIFYLDPIVLNFAVELEELESEFFNRAMTSSGFAGLDERQSSVMATIAAQDRMHFEKLSGVRALRGDSPSRGNQAASTRPRFFRFGNLNTPAELMKTALDIKETSLFAYHGAVGLLKDPNLLLAAAGIAGVEGRHAAAMREVMNLAPVPAPYEGALVAQLSGQKLSRYGFVGGASL